MTIGFHDYWVLELVYTPMLSQGAYYYVFPLYQ